MLIIYTFEIIDDPFKTNFKTDHYNMLVPNILRLLRFCFLTRKDVPTVTLLSLLTDEPQKHIDVIWKVQLPKVVRTSLTSSLTSGVLLLTKYCMYLLFTGKSYAQNLSATIFTSKRLFNLFKELCFVYVPVKCMHGVRLLACLTDFHLTHIFGLQ